MKILLVSSFLPYPIFSGGHVRLFNLLKQLSKQHEITLVCEKRKYQTEKDIEEVKKYCKEIYVVDRKKQWSFDVILKTTFSSLPFLIQGHTLPKMKKIISILLDKNKYDLIHVETFYVYQNLPETKLPVVLVEHNIEYEVYQRFVDNAPVIARPFLQLDVEKIKYWEKYFWEKAKIVVAVSKLEAKKIGSKTKVVANGVDTKNFKFKISMPTDKKKRILFIGDFKWIQNKDSAKWILKEIWPEINSRFNDVTLWVVGKNIPESLKQMKTENVLFEDSKLTTPEIFAKSYILLSPIRVGGGTSYKILEAMVSGVPVVTTSLGIEGLGEEVETNALIGNSSIQIAEKVSQLLTDSKTYERIRKNARNLVEKNYSWETISKGLNNIYEEAIK